MLKRHSQYAPKSAHGQNRNRKNSKLRVAAVRSTPSIFETLEDRRLMSTSIVLSNGVLALTGDANEGSRLIATLGSDGRIHASASGGKLDDFPASSVKSIKITGGRGGDYVYLSTNFTAPVTILTGEGNDSVSGGGGDNTIITGDGDNWINTRGRHNYVSVGDGDATVIGGSGDDTIVAGDGDVLLDGANGNDSITAGDGRGTFSGQSGNDTIIAGNGDDCINGGLGNDRLVAGTGLSTFIPGSGTNYIVTGNLKSIVIPSAGKNTVVDAKGNMIADPAASTAKPRVVPAWVAFSAASPSSGSPRAILELLAPAPYVGIAIDVRGSSSSFGAGSAITANFQWDFGDPGSAYNNLPGFNASHVYSKPGTYTIKLTITSENGKRSTVSTQLAIGSGNRKQFFVDSVYGDDDNSGTSTTAPVRTIAKAATLVRDNTEILFRRGQKFNTTQTLMAPYTNVVFGAYGSGDKPVIQQVGRTGKPGVLMSTQDVSAGVTFRDLALDTTGMESDPRNSKGEAMGIVPRGTDIAIINVTFLHVVYAINANGNFNGLTVMDSDSPNAQGLQGYFIWAEGDNMVVLNNKVNGSIHEHVVRTSTSANLLIMDNDFTNNNGKGGIEIHDGDYAWIAYNKVTNADIRVGPLGLWNEAVTSSTNYSVIEGNTIINNNVHLYPGSHHVSIRNNVIRRDGSVMIAITANDNAGRYVSDVQILHNTGINNIGSGKFLHVESHTRGIILANNLLIQPNLNTGGNAASPVNVSENDLSSFTLIDGNVWPLPDATRFAGTGVNFVGTTYVGSAYRTPSQWNAMTPVGTDYFSNVSINSSGAPSSNSIAASAADWVAGMFIDLYGKDRPDDESWTAGAVQL